MHSLFVVLEISLSFFYHFNQTKDLLRDGWCDFGALAASVWTTIRTRIYCSCKFYSERDISYVNILVSAIGSLGRRTKECLLGSNSLNIDREKQPICSDACPCIIYNCTLLMNIMLHFFEPFFFRRSQLCLLERLDLLFGFQGINPHETQQFS